MSEKQSKHYKPRKRNTALDQHIGNRVLLLRHAQEMNLEELAEKIGISYQQLAKYEKGTNRIAASTLYEIAQYFGMSVEFFYQDYKALQSNMTVEGIKAMDAVNKVMDEQSRKKIIKHIIPIIKAFDVFFVEQALNQQCKKMLEERK
jgi:transcriptional regulator with XRE-family HTH domain